MWRADPALARHLALSRRFDAVLEPTEAAAAADRGVTAAAPDGPLAVPPVMLLDPDELNGAEASRAALGLAPGRPAVLVQLGAGNNNDIDRVLDHIAAAQRRLDLQVVVAEWLIQHAPVRRRGLRYLSAFPNARHFRAFDFAVSAAGYNSFHELLHHGLPCIFVPNDEQKVDDQRARAEWAESRGAAICLPARRGRGARRLHVGPARSGPAPAAGAPRPGGLPHQRRVRRRCRDRRGGRARLRVGMATHLKPAAQGELDRLRGLVADQHRRWKVVRGELSPAALAGVVVEPLPPRCIKPRLTAAALARLMEEARARLELMDTTLGALHWSAWPEHRPQVPVLRPTPGLAAYALRGVPNLPNLVLALFRRPPGEIEGAIAKALAEQQAGEPFTPGVPDLPPRLRAAARAAIGLRVFPARARRGGAGPRAALGRLLRHHAGAHHATVGRPTGRDAVSAVVATSPRLRLAQALLAQSRADEAEQVLLPLAGAKDAEAQAALAALHLAQGRLGQAAACARAAIASGPLPARTLVAVTGTLARAHDPEAADTALARAIDAGDAAIELRIARARLAEERGRTDLALRHWQRVLSLAAEHVDGRLGMVRSLRGEARFAEAERLCRELIAGAPKDTRADRRARPDRARRRRPGRGGGALARRPPGQPGPARRR